MITKKSYDELRVDIQPYVKYVGKHITHLASGHVYYVLNVGFKEADMSIEFSYFPIGTPDIVFYRPIEELLDGRYGGI